MRAFLFESVPPAVNHVPQKPPSKDDQDKIIQLILRNISFELERNNKRINGVLAGFYDI